MVEGLPGVGNVGRLCARHLIRTFEGEKVADMYSTAFPHQVRTLADGTLARMGNEIHLVRSGVDMLILSGQMQPLPTDFQSHYRMAGEILDFCRRAGVEMLITVGGYSSKPEDPDSPRVYRAASNLRIRERIDGLGLDLSDPETGTPIVGASGLLPALAPEWGIDSVCLLGETESEIKPDVGAARAVLSRISGILDVEIDPSGIEDSAADIEEEVDSLVRRIQQLGKIKLSLGDTAEDYIH